jgi:hypothetical protein
VGPQAAGWCLLPMVGLYRRQREQRVRGCRSPHLPISARPGGHFLKD